MAYEQDERSESPRQERRFLSLGAILGVGGVGLLATFMAQNTDKVRLDFLTWSFTWPVWLLCLISAVAGAVVWFAAGVVRRHRRRVARRAARRGD
jgi:uncharacterized integral membrane protein